MYFGKAAQIDFPSAALNDGIRHQLLVLARAAAQLSIEWLRFICFTFTILQSQHRHALLLCTYIRMYIYLYVLPRLPSRRHHLSARSKFDRWLAWQTFSSIALWGLCEVARKKCIKKWVKESEMWACKGSWIILLSNIRQSSLKAEHLLNTLKVTLKKVWICIEIWYIYAVS